MVCNFNFLIVAALWFAQVIYQLYHPDSHHYSTCMHSHNMERLGKICSARINNPEDRAEVIITLGVYPMKTLYI